MDIAYIGLGSNLGDRLTNLRNALDRLLAPSTIAPDGGNALAGIYETAPVGMDSATPPFLNSAVRVRYELSPTELLEHLLAIETALGRVWCPTVGSRIVDLDLLLFNAMVIAEPGLILPHPRLHERRFVLEPLSEIGPDLRHPRLAKTLAELANQARTNHADQAVTRLFGGNWYAGIHASELPTCVDPAGSSQDQVCRRLDWTPLPG